VSVQSGASALQVPLLIVELVLLVATLAVLLLNRRESRSREKLMQHFTSVADVITRQEYFVAVVETIQRAERWLCGSVTGSPPSHEEAEVIEQILKAIADATSRGVAVKYLIPLAPDRLQMAKRYRGCGAEVRLHPSLLVNDVRYMLVDDEVALIGVPARKGKKEPTRKGYTIPSESVVHLFKTQFDSQWNSPEAKSYEQYLRELVGQAKSSNPDISAELVAGNLGLDKGDVQSVLESIQSGNDKKKH
jgi:hypothetical protein